MTPILAHAGEEAAFVVIPAAVFFVLWRARRRRSGADDNPARDAALERRLAAEFERRYGQGTYPGKVRASGESGSADSGPAERLPS